MAVEWKRLAYEDDVVLKSLYDANTILAADADNTPAALEVTEQTLLGRITAGNVAALSVGDVQTLLNISDGADVTGDNAPQAHAASHKNGGGDELLLNELGEPDGAIALDGQELQDAVIHQVADEAAVAAYASPVVGKILFATSELTAWICTSAA